MGYNITELFIKPFNKKPTENFKIHIFIIWNISQKTFAKGQNSMKYTHKKSTKPQNEYNFFLTDTNIHTI